MGVINPFITGRGAPQPQPKNQTSHCRRLYTTGFSCSVWSWKISQSNWICMGQFVRSHDSIISRLKKTNGHLGSKKQTIKPLLFCWTFCWGGIEGVLPFHSQKKNPHRFRSPSSPKACVRCTWTCARSTTSPMWSSPWVLGLPWETGRSWRIIPVLFVCNPGLAALTQGQIYKPCKLVLKIHSEFGSGISCVFIASFFQKKFDLSGETKAPHTLVN